MNTCSAGNPSESLPPITVLLTVYNGMPFLEEAVQSILQQRNAEFLFLVINNGSIDGSKEYLDAINDSRMRVLHLEHTLERTEALNYGLTRVTTKYTAVIDADDISCQGRLAEQSAFLDANEDIVLVGSNVCFIDTQGKTKYNLGYPSDHTTLVEYLVVENQFAHSACMYRTAFAVEVGGYPTKYKYAQDFGLWLAMIKHGGKVASLQKTFAKVRLHPQQVSRDKGWQQLRLEEKRMQTEEIMALPGLSPNAKRLVTLREGFILMQGKRKIRGMLKALLGLKDARMLIFPLLLRRGTLKAKRIKSTIGDWKRVRKDNA